MDLKLLVFLFIFTITYSSALEQNFTNASIEVSVDIPATQEWSEIEINTTSIDFGELNLSTGSTTDSRRLKYEIRNRGNVNISVTPLLWDNNDIIFNYLEFGRTYTSGWRAVGNYSIEMNRTYNVGDWNPWFLQSIQLDLGDYIADHGQIPFDISNHRNSVVFWVMPRYN